MQWETCLMETTQNLICAAASVAFLINPSQSFTHALCFTIMLQSVLGNIVHCFHYTNWAGFARSWKSILMLDEMGCLKMPPVSKNQGKLLQQLVFSTQPCSDADPEVFLHVTLSTWKHVLTGSGIPNVQTDVSWSLSWVSENLPFIELFPNGMNW